MRAFARTNFLHRRRRIFVSSKKKKSGLYSWPVYTVTRFPRLPCSHHRAIFPGGFSPVVSWRARPVIGGRYRSNYPATGFNLQVGLFRASQTRRLPACLSPAIRNFLPILLSRAACACRTTRRAVHYILFALRLGAPSVGRQFCGGPLASLHRCNLIVVTKTINAIYNDDFE